MSAHDVQEYVVLRKKQEAPLVTTLVIALPNGNIPVYKAGQYITVYFFDSSTPQGKAYSISSAPTEHLFTISIKAIGEYSHRLCAMNSGDTFFGSLPKGGFYSEQIDTDIIMLASGTGITPFRSMIIDTVQNAQKRALFLFYSHRTTHDALFTEEFESIQKNYTTIHIENYITRESAKPQRIMIPDILSIVQNNRQGEFFICGPTSFVREQRVALQNAGVLSEYIHTEACS